MSSPFHRLLSLLLLLAAGLPAPLGAAEPEPQTLFAAGDTMLARWVHQCVYRRGAERGFAEIHHLVRDADVALTNLECVVSTRGDFFDKGERRPFLYRGRPELLDVITSAGFDVVATANNHSMDFGPEALLEQHEFLEATGIASAGSGPDRSAARSPAYVRSGDVILAFIGLEDSFPMFAATADRAGVFHAPTDEMVEALAGPIAEARKHAHLVVVTPHWGRNWKDAPTEDRIHVARQIIDLGADAILGHSSHHIHGVEVHEGHPIVYDMGSLFFDAVGQENLRFSAGWVLDFDREGFHRLTVHPLKLKSCRVTLAQGSSLDRIQDWLEERSRALDPDIPLSWEGDAMVVSLDPTPRSPPASPPENVHETGSTRPLPPHFRERKPDLVRETLPAWCDERFEPVVLEPESLERRITVHCWRHAEAVRPRRAFVAEVVLEVSGPLEGRWEGIVAGRKRDGKDTFSWLHPVADGAWDPHLWEPGQIVVDRTLVRPRRVPTGTYDLSYRFVNVLEGRKPLRRLTPSADGSATDVPMGSIEIRSKGIPKGPAGITWDGRLPDKKGEPAAKTERSWLPLAVLGALLLLGIGLAVHRFRRPRA